MTPQALKEFRQSQPQCELAVYADLASGTVLGADGALRYPQEILDALCACAAAVFDAGLQTGDSLTDHVYFAGASGTRGFFRSPAEPTEALCCICTPDVDAARFLNAARAALDAVDTEG